MMVVCCLRKFEKQNKEKQTNIFALFNNEINFFWYTSINMLPKSQTIGTDTHKNIKQTDG